MCTIEIIDLDAIVELLSEKWVFLFVHICTNMFSRSEASTLQRTELNYVLPSSRLPHYKRLAALGHNSLFFNIIWKPPDEYPGKTKLLFCRIINSPFPHFNRRFSINSLYVKDNSLEHGHFGKPMLWPSAARRLYCGRWEEGRT